VWGKAACLPACMASKSNIHFKGFMAWPMFATAPIVISRFFSASVEEWEFGLKYYLFFSFFSIGVPVYKLIPETPADVGVDDELIL
jgi:hypothetical protein